MTKTLAHRRTFALVVGIAGTALLAGCGTTSSAAPAAVAAPASEAPAAAAAAQAQARAEAAAAARAQVRAEATDLLGAAGSARTAGNLWTAWTIGRQAAAKDQTFAEAQQFVAAVEAAIRAPVGFRVPEAGGTPAAPMQFRLVSVEHQEVLADKDKRLRSDDQYTYLVMRFTVQNLSDATVRPDALSVALRYQEASGAPGGWTNPNSREDEVAYSHLGSPQQVKALGGWGTGIQLDQTQEFLAVWRVPRNPSGLEWSVVGSAAPKDLLPRWLLAQHSGRPA